MSLIWPVLLIIAGVVLRANDQWFNGAHDVGNICFWVGIGLAVFCLFIFLVIMGGFAKLRRGGR